jgi:hypothetical protein
MVPAGYPAPVTPSPGTRNDPGQARVGVANAVLYLPVLGFLPWLAFDLRALSFRLVVFFDIGRRGYRRVQARSSSAPHELTTRSTGTPRSAARSQP